MSGGRDYHAERLAQESAAKELAAQQAKKVERDRVIELARQHSKYFPFGEATWVSKCLKYQACKDPAAPSVGVPLFEKLIPKWLRHHWRNRVKSHAVDVGLLDMAMSKVGLDVNSATLSFEEIVSVIYAYQELHIEAEESAGFSDRDLAKFHKFFAQYDKRGTGLQARALWAILSDMGIHLRDSEEQAWLIATVRYLDKDRSGSFDFNEFCQLLRKLEMRYEAEKRSREHELIVQSSMPLEEVEEWFEVFDKRDRDRTGELTVPDVCLLLETVGIKVDSHNKETMITWIREADSNANGTLEFGEFCCLISRIYQENLCGIQQATKDAKASMSAAIEEDKEEPASGNLMARRLADRWAKLTVDVSKGEICELPEPASPTSPTSKQAMLQLEEALQSNLASNA